MPPARETITAAEEAGEVGGFRGPSGAGSALDHDLMRAVQALSDEYRDQCLWFLRRDYYPSEREEVLRLLAYIERYGDLKASQQRAEIRRWLSQRSSAASASS